MIKYKNMIKIIKNIRQKIGCLYTIKPLSDPVLCRWLIILFIRIGYLYCFFKYYDIYNANLLVYSIHIGGPSIVINYLYSILYNIVIHYKFRCLEMIAIFWLGMASIEIISIGPFNIKDNKSDLVLINKHDEIVKMSIVNWFNVLLLRILPAVIFIILSYISYYCFDINYNITSKILFALPLAGLRHYIHSLLYIIIKTPRPNIIIPFTNIYTRNKIKVYSLIMLITAFYMRNADYSIWSILITMFIMFLCRYILKKIMKK